MIVLLPSGHAMQIDDADCALFEGLVLHADVRSHTVYVRGRAKKQQRGPTTPSLDSTTASSRG